MCNKKGRPFIIFSSSVLFVSIVAAIMQYFFKNELCDIIITLLFSMFCAVLFPSLRPKICVGSVSLNGTSKINVLVYNKASRGATNIRIEACLMNAGKSKTIHLTPDREHFLSLPSNGNENDTETNRVFKCEIDPTKYPGGIQPVLQSHPLVRVRVYGEDEISGFGRLTEEYLIYDWNSNQFVRCV